MSKDPQQETNKLLKSILDELKEIRKQTHPRAVERERLRAQQMRRDGERRAAMFGNPHGGETGEG